MGIWSVIIWSQTGCRPRATNCRDQTGILYRGRTENQRGRIHHAAVCQLLVICGSEVSHFSQCAERCAAVQCAERVIHPNWILRFLRLKKQKARRRNMMKVLACWPPCHTAGAPTMVARRTSRGSDTHAVDADANGKSNGALSVAERRVAKQRERREKKRVEKNAVGAIAHAKRGGVVNGTATKRPSKGLRCSSVMTVGIDDDEVGHEASNDDGYVGMFLDEGDDDGSDDDGSSDDGDEKKNKISQKATRTTLTMDFGVNTAAANERDTPQEYVGMFLDQSDDEDAVSSDDTDESDDDDENNITLENQTLETVPKIGSFGNYGRSDGRMSLEDDEWATSLRTWQALSPYLKKFHKTKVWMPFYYDGEAGERLKKTGFEKVVHKREDFFKRVNDSGFTKQVSCVIDNPPYTGKGIKEKVLTALVTNSIAFCLLLPIGVLHGASIRKILDQKQTQVLIPRRCFVSKKGKPEIPFKHLVWLCHGLGLERDLELMPDE